MQWNWRITTLRSAQPDTTHASSRRLSQPADVGLGRVSSLPASRRSHSEDRSTLVGRFYGGRGLRLERSVHSHIVIAMSIPAQPPSAPKFTVVAGLDFTDADGPAFEQAVRLVVRVPGGELHLVHVFGTAPSPEQLGDLSSHLRLYVNEMAEITPGLRGVEVGIHLRGGKTVREIVQLATDVQADLIVVGSHKGPHVKDWILGSTVERLVSSAGFPVLVAAPRPKSVEKHEPAIERPCPQCVAARVASGGKQWWCERHAHEAVTGHTYSYQSELPFSAHD